MLGPCFHFEDGAPKKHFVCLCVLLVCSLGNQNLFNRLKKKKKMDPEKVIIK